MCTPTLWLALKLHTPTHGTKNGKMEMTGSEIVDRTVPHRKASHVLGQVSAPSPTEMYEADPEGPSNLHSSFILDSLDTTEILKTRKITFSWNLPEKWSSNRTWEGTWEIYTHMCSSEHTSVPKPAGARQHSHWQEEWRCKSRWMPGVACQYKIRIWHGA